MLRKTTATICPYCELRALVRPSCLQSRTYAQVYKQRPARMELSKRVGQASPKDSPTGRPTNWRRSNGPFGGMNQTEARIRAAPSRQPSRPPSKYSTGGRESTTSAKNPKQGFKSLKMQQSLATIGYGRRAAIKDYISSVWSFDQLGLLPIIQESIQSQALLGQASIKPTPVQRLAIPALLGTSSKRRHHRSVEKEKMEQFLIAAETGSGKTLAYLLPVIDAMKREELLEKEEEKEKKNAVEASAAQSKSQRLFEVEAPPLSNVEDTTTGRPRVIILVPSAELVAQVGALAKSLSHTIKYRAAFISSHFSTTTVQNRVFSPNGIDLLISTPHLLGSIAKENPNVLSKVTHMVIDEADSLLDRSFSPLTQEIIDRSTPSLKKLIMCSATIPRSLDAHLRDHYPDVKRLVTPNLHAIPRRVQLGVVDVEKAPYFGKKTLACADIIWSIGMSKVEHYADGEDVEESSAKRIIVFVNERLMTDEVTDYLCRRGIDAVALNRDHTARQDEILASFASTNPSRVAKNESWKPRPQNSTLSGPSLKNVRVLVSTDLGSRGIDTRLVKHVILYDVPHTTIDFIHRLGRTGRMGARGRGIVLVGKNDRRDIVKEVREGMFKGHALI